MFANQLGRSDEASNTLDPTLTTFSYSTTTSSQTNAVTFMIDPSSNVPQIDVFSPSYLSNLPIFNPNELFNDLPRSSHDDLNQFFNDAAFGGGTPGGGRLLGTKFSGEISPLPVAMTQNWLRNMQQSTSVSMPDWENQERDEERENGNGNGNGNGSVVDTKLDSKQRETVIKNGQATPGDSPSSPKSAKGIRKITRKSKASAKLEAAAPATTASDQTPVPAKRARKPRRSNKKIPTPEEEALKRETFLKRNREAAYKCRIKKKNQTEGVIERAKMLDADNAMKGLEVERLRREIEGLRALLLPHWRGCGDQNVSSYVDNLVNSGWGLGKMVLGAVAPRPKFEVEDEPREDDGRNEERSLSHPRGEDGENESGEPAHKRRRSSAIFEIPIPSCEDSMTQQAADRQRRESFFGNSQAPEILSDALGSQRGSIGSASLSSSGAATPAVRATLMGASGMDILSEEFLFGDTPPPLDLSAPDGDGH